MFRPFFLAAITVSLFLLPSCKKSGTTKDVYDMGDKVRVGALTYNVLETQWRSQLGDFPANRIPERNFLLIRVSVTNSGGAERSIPLLNLESSPGDTFTEISDGKGVDHWLGLLRRMPPATTDDGWILFDVPTNSYKLRVTDSDADGNEKVALVNIPLHMEQ